MDGEYYEQLFLQNSKYLFSPARQSSGWYQVNTHQNVALFFQFNDLVSEEQR